MLAAGGGGDPVQIARRGVIIVIKLIWIIKLVCFSKSTGCFATVGEGGKLRTCLQSVETVRCRYLPRT